MFHCFESYLDEDVRPRYLFSWHTVLYIYSNDTHSIYYYHMCVLEYLRFIGSLVYLTLTCIDGRQNSLMFVHAYLLTIFHRCIDEHFFIIFKRVDGFHHVTSFPYRHLVIHRKLRRSSKHDNNFTLCTFHIKSATKPHRKFFLLYISEGNHLRLKR